MHVFAPHEDFALHAEQGTYGRGGNTVLSCTGLGNDAPLAHASRQQRLPERVVDLVRAGVTEVFALQVDLRAAELGGQMLREVERRLATGVLGEVVLELAPELGVAADAPVGRIELEQRRHQGLGDVAAAEDAEVTVTIRQRVHVR